MIVGCDTLDEIDLIADLAGTRDEVGAQIMTELILVDSPAEHVRRITLNRPEKRNAISTPLRCAARAAPGP